MTGKYPRARVVAALGCIAVVLVALVAANRLRESPPAAYVVGSADGNQSSSGVNRPIDEYFRQYLPFMDPVPLGGRVVVSGDPGVAAVVQADPGAGPAAFTVLIRNIGDKPIDGSFSSGGAWLDSDQGERFYPPQVRLLSSGAVSPAAIGPRAEILLQLLFTVPAHARPARLILALRLGQYYPNAQWNLPPPISR